jgi:hypothetical protein
MMVKALFYKHFPHKFPYLGGQRNRWLLPIGVFGSRAKRSGGPEPETENWNARLVVLLEEKERSSHSRYFVPFSGA